MNKSQMSETDIRTKFITPAIIAGGWNVHTQIREEYTFTDGRIEVRGSRSSRKERKRADYVLYLKSGLNLPLAIVEAKDNKKNMGSGIQQAIDYGEILDIPFVYSSNGDGFIEYDRTTGKEIELSLDKFPSPERLWERYKLAKGITTERSEQINTTPYFYTRGDKTPRYYQRVAINRTVEAIAKGQDRILLVMATGTGKTYTAFQIIYRLWKSREKKRILFLADRNILIDQTMTNDFKSFGDKMIKINGNNITKAHEIYLGLYQSMIGPEEQQQKYKQFSPDFFDLIVIDECHRGSAKDDSAWRVILDYFKSATQVGLTATPKETDKVSNTDYFGEPIYSYSLKQGIDDGFLAPYKVIRYGLDKDLMGFRPEKGQKDKYGHEITDEEYFGKDFDNKIVLEKRTELVAHTISEYLKLSNERFSKTIVFCVDIDHAERMRSALVNENSDLCSENSKYIMKITGDDQLGKAQLDNFIDPNSKYPVIVTTSKLLTTGVDAKTCKLIVLDSNIGSMTEFKQIIGRGTRVDEVHGKTYFTIMDFRNVSRMFADPAFDGDPIPDDGYIPINDKPDEGVEEPEKSFGDENPKEEYKEKKQKFYIEVVNVSLLQKQVQYMGMDGKLITESLVDYTKKNLQKQFASFDNFLDEWNRPILKRDILKELEDKGIFFDDLKSEIKNKEGVIVGEEMDEFELICHIAFDKPMMTKKDRVAKLKKSNYFDKYNETAKKVLNALLDKYISNGLVEIESVEILKLDEFKNIGSPISILKAFDFKEKDDFTNIVISLENSLYNIERGGLSVDR